MMMTRRSGCRGHHILVRLGSTDGFCCQWKAQGKSVVIAQQPTQGSRSDTAAAAVSGVIFFGFMINALGELLSHAGQTARRATLLHNKIQVLILSICVAQASPRNWMYMKFGNKERNSIFPPLFFVVGSCLCKSCPLQVIYIWSNIRNITLRPSDRTGQQPLRSRLLMKLKAFSLFSGFSVLGQLSDKHAFHYFCFTMRDVQDVETWMSARELPRKLRYETVAYFCDAWVAQAGQPTSHTFPVDHRQPGGCTPQRFLHCSHSYPDTVPVCWSSD